MNTKCSKCGLVSFPDASVCTRCETTLDAHSSVIRPVSKPQSRIAARIMVCIAMCVTALLGFYLSLVASANPLSIEEKSTVRAAIRVLKEKGLADEIFLLEHLAVFRSNDNWLNASVAKENAYAATNFPFEIITLYPDFFTYPVDDVERAAILLHESRHLRGKDEKDAYEFVWRHRRQLGWVEEKYSESPVWRNVRRQTREYSPELFNCDSSPTGDCNE